MFTVIIKIAGFKVLISLCTWFLFNYYYSVSCDMLLCDSGIHLKIDYFLSNSKFLIIIVNM